MISISQTQQQLHSSESSRRLNSPWLIFVPSWYSPSRNKWEVLLQIIMVWLVSPWRWRESGVWYWLVLSHNIGAHTSAVKLTFFIISCVSFHPTALLFCLSPFTWSYSLLLSSVSGLTRCDQVNVIWAVCCQWLRCRGIVYTIRAVCTPQTGCTVHLSHICSGRRGWCDTFQSNSIAI